jgi:hypothetical protein
MSQIATVMERGHLKNLDLEMMLRVEETLSKYGF